MSRPECLCLFVNSRECSCLFRNRPECLRPFVNRRASFGTARNAYASFGFFIPNRRRNSPCKLFGAFHTTMFIANAPFPHRLRQQAQPHPISRNAVTNSSSPTGNIAAIRIPIPRATAQIPSNAIPLFPHIRHASSPRPVTPVYPPGPVRVPGGAKFSGPGKFMVAKTHKLCYDVAEGGG